MFEGDFSTKELSCFYATIGLNVKKIRTKKKKSQLELALAIGHSSASFIAKAEIGIEGKHFNLEHLYKISKILEVDIRDFLTSPLEEDLIPSSPILC
ncbi:helix-turn-helix domain-containing protein [Wolinella succinogenes]|uniref:helix-turn-helix domain-containing protein n=1 Tax=Wolinella succinogenes TaxID=844 RepID=UPI002FCAB366